MARVSEEFLRRRIDESFRQSTERIDREVALALLSESQFHHHFTGEELHFVFANIIYTLVDLQKFAGLSVPLTHNVASIGVDIQYPRISVSTLLHIHSPIKAFISIDFKLANHPDRPGALCPVKGTIRLDEITARFDFFAKSALRMIDIKGLITEELQDPSQAVRKTLPPRFRMYGFDGDIRDVYLEVTQENALHVRLTS